jgi:hypothetical protein
MEIMYVLTRSINEYHQEGDYLVAAFKERPSEQKLVKLIGCTREYARHILDKGGRKDVENEWFHITPLAFDSRYEEKEC